MPSNPPSLTDETLINQAWQWLCKRRQHYPPQADIWWLRQHWPAQKAELIEQLLSGTYTFEPLQRITRSDGSSIELWAARDALVLKILSLVVGHNWNIPEHCTHIAGNGGTHKAVTQLTAALPDYRFVFRTDVRAFYASINHDVLLNQLYGRISDRVVRRLLYQYLKRVVVFGGLYQSIEKGISLGCPLSPLIGAICLLPVDEALADAPGAYYVRFMDDWVLLCKTRRQLRRAVKRTNQILAQLRLEKHPDKTFIGPIARGFDFLGFHFDTSGVRVSQTTSHRFFTKLFRLYEQSPAMPNSMARVWDYLVHWCRWVISHFAAHRENTRFPNLSCDDTSTVPTAHV